MEEPNLVQLETKVPSFDDFAAALEAAPAASPKSGHRKSFGLGVQSPRSGRSLRSEAGAPIDKLRRKQAKKEILRRALTPPIKRPTLRWLDFRPTPSRLCNMSSA